ncbi:MAG TPA: response regulator, partial [Gemmatimonadaceae bacterium]|nr:response regulator [Gemmatimonadaceae bacterium]
MPPAPPPTAAPVRLLVVEDHDDLAEALQVSLKREGYAVDVARDGRQALAMVRRTPPDVVVLDLGLPGLDGFGVLQRLRAENVWCPVLILSARDADADKVEGFRAGADDYVTKPFRTVELLARIGALARRALRERAGATSPGAGAMAGAAAPGDAGVMSDAYDPATAAQGVIGFSDTELGERYGLTQRQVEIVRMLAAGLSNPEIADALSISRFTARNHTQQVLFKLGLPSRARVASALRAAYDRERGAATRADG